MEFNKEAFTVIGKAGLKVGKAIIIEGTKAVAVKGVSAIIMDGFSVKDMTVDKFVSGGKVKETKEEKPKKKLGLFKRKSKEEQIDLDEGLGILGEDNDGNIVELEYVREEETKED